MATLYAEDGLVDVEKKSDGMVRFTGGNENELDITVAPEQVVKFAIELLDFITSNYDYM